MQMGRIGKNIYVKTWMVSIVSLNFKLHNWSISGEGTSRDVEAVENVLDHSITKIKTSHAFFSEIKRCLDAMPFTLRAFENEKKVLKGMVM